MFLWKDEDYDYAFVLRMMQYKLKRTREHILDHDIIVESEEVAAQIQRAENLIELVIGDSGRSLDRTPEEEERDWAELFDHLQTHMRWWWD
jgi:hypothetical protein